MYIPGVKSKGQIDTKYVDTCAEESSTAKKANEQEREALRDQVHFSNLNAGNKFFRGPSSAATGDALELGEPAAAASKKDGDTPAKRQRKVELESELPKAYEEFRKALATCESNMKAALTSVDHRQTELAEHYKVHPNAGTGDRALLLILRSLQFRTQLALRWQSAPDFALWLLPASAPVKGEPVPGTPAFTSSSSNAGSPAPSTAGSLFMPEAPGTPSHFLKGRTGAEASPLPVPAASPDAKVRSPLKELAAEAEADDSRGSRPRCKGETQIEQAQRAGLHCR